MIDDLLNKLSSQEKKTLDKNIFAPFIKGGSQILIRMNNIIYKLKTKKFKRDGFGVFKATDSNNARFVRDAEPYEVDEYLQLLPKVDFILTFKLGRWLAYPFNAIAFKQRFKVEPKLFSVLMVDNAEMLDPVTARFDGSNFWFESIKFGGDVERKEKLRERIEDGSYTIPESLKSGLTPEENVVFKHTSEFHKQASMSDLERRLHGELGKYNAQMDKYVERGDNVSVQWKDKQTNAKYTSVFSKSNLAVVTAGICLSGGDTTFDIQSLVGVCRQADGNGATVHIGDGGMADDRYWDMYGGER